MYVSRRRISMQVHGPLCINVGVRWRTSRHRPELHVVSARGPDVSDVSFRPDHHESIIFQQKVGKTFV